MKIKEYLKTGRRTKLFLMGELSSYAYEKILVSDLSSLRTGQVLVDFSYDEELNRNL